MNNITYTDKHRSSTGNVTAVIYVMYALALIIPNTLAFISLQRVKNIPKKIKFPIMNLTVSDLLTGLSFIFHIFLLSSDLPEAMLKFSCHFLQIWTLTSAFASFSVVGGLAIDRCICIYYEYFYLTRVTTKRIRVWQAINWIVSFFFAILIFVDTNWDAPCRYRYIVGKYGRIIHIYYSIFLRLISAVAFALICTKIKKMRDRDGMNGVTTRGIFRTTYKVLVIGLTFHGMYFPLFCHHVFVLIYPDKFDDAHGVYLIASILIVLNSFVNPFLYVWRFPECRLQLKMLICFWNKDLMETAKKKRKHMIVSFLTEPEVLLTT